ncbi:16S rRNA pseudouridine516 synthase [Clostridium collagenovorans DSM 3089]|uniref:Pseudouridine synthase n=1 Tax=Clostridium collagenovorans DSM 3089 TaxID=1121306 RepID=A0A1M5YLM8_9CLOT|nr:pseudouridine synthase [Clostridium collagenovorans]SHI12839.1 16S rRNA pseudouridine516 synthase [Clostridium collagenovorans DSM 3089]
MERLDKVLANVGYGTRKEVKILTKKGEVLVNGKIVKDSSAKVDPYKDDITVSGEKVLYREFIYLMMNKPDGVVSATFDNYDETVIDLLDEEYKVFEPFPIGRLDKDTVGLLLITNDGALNHKLISPKNHVDKVYYAEIDKAVNEKDVAAFKNGIVLDDGYKCMPGKLEILKADEDGSEVLVTIQEGKFHQVKRMFKSRDKEVVYLRRESFGPLKLDESIDEGFFRELTPEEVEALQSV